MHMQLNKDKHKQLFRLILLKSSLSFLVLQDSFSVPKKKYINETLHVQGSVDVNVFFFGKKTHVSEDSASKMCDVSSNISFNI